MPRHPSTPQPTIIENLLVKGFSGLDDYAGHFWIDHLLTYTGVTPIDARCPDLNKTLILFASSWMPDWASPLADESTDQQTETSIPFGTHPAIHEMIRKVLAFRKQSKVHEETSGSSECMDSSSTGQDTAKSNDSTPSVANRSRSNLSNARHDFGLEVRSNTVCHSARQCTFASGSDGAAPFQTFVWIAWTSMPPFQLQNDYEALCVRSRQTYA